MNAIRHLATCTNNNRRIARFYRLVFGIDELWNDRQNSPYSFYISDGFINLNCLLVHPGMKRNPGVGLEHFGFFVNDLDETAKKIVAFKPSAKIEESPRDGRFEDKRFHDPEGNRLEIATNPWGTEGTKRAPGIRHIAIHAKDPERLADFYKSVFSMKEVGKTLTQDPDSTVIYMSDGAFSLSLIKNAPVDSFGIQLIGIQVESIKAIEERLKTCPPFLYEGEPVVEILRRPRPGPFKECYLRDPDGNCVDLSEEGWPL
jgi:catechol 2,3-dioxygenase-like lactoylglutathione lyase family enzyme